MGFLKRLIVAAEHVNVPDFVTEAGIRYMVGRSSKHLNGPAALSDSAFLDLVSKRPIAVHADKANDQHYEIAAEFFGLILGPNRKYSCCLFDDGATTLAEAEADALAATVHAADLQGGQDILEMGCGWGSLSLYMAERFAAAKITAVSNSHSQRAHIEEQATARGLANLRVVTSDMNEFDPHRQYDRIVSVEMFEHMSNWRQLLEKARGWIKADGRMFIHVFTHERSAYLFDESDRSDWIAQNFFTGGIMPSHSLIRQFPDLFQVEQEWRWNGMNYAHTARHWLANFDRNSEPILEILREFYGAEASLWHRRWRLFFLATSGLFGHNGGKEWAVSHYRLVPDSAN
ncbi:MAG: cyclopropane-fatty-acyl-phospholipid synthase family protein [Hyphomicrobiaceae bacterium]